MAPVFWRAQGSMGEHLGWMSEWPRDFSKLPDLGSKHGIQKTLQASGQMASRCGVSWRQTLMSSKERLSRALPKSILWEPYLGYTSCRCESNGSVWIAPKCFLLAGYIVALATRLYNAKHVVMTCDTPTHPAVLQLILSADSRQYLELPGWTGLSFPEDLGLLDLDEAQKTTYEQRPLSTRALGQLSGCCIPMQNIFSLK